MSQSAIGKDLRVGMRIIDRFDRRLAGPFEIRRVDRGGQIVGNMGRQARRKNERMIASVEHDTIHAAPRTVLKEDEHQLGDGFLSGRTRCARPLGLVDFHHAHVVVARADVDDGCRGATASPPRRLLAWEVVPAPKPASCHTVRPVASANKATRLVARIGLTRVLRLRRSEINSRTRSSNRPRQPRIAVDVSNAVKFRDRAATRESVSPYVTGCCRAST